MSAKPTVMTHLVAAKEALNRQLLAALKTVEILQSDITEVDSLIKRHSGQQEMDLAISDLSAVAKDYLGLTLRRAILAALHRVAGEPQNSALIADELLNGGFLTKSENLKDQVSTLMSDMAKKGEIIKDRPGWYYVQEE